MERYFPRNGDDLRAATATGRKPTHQTVANLPVLTRRTSASRRMGPCLVFAVAGSVGVTVPPPVFPPPVLAPGSDFFPHDIIPVNSSIVKIKCIFFMKPVYGKYSP